MWRSMSLRNRLNLIFGSLLALWLAFDVSRIIIEASARARAETENAMRLTKEFVTTTLDRLQDASEPERAIETLLASLENVRHVRVGIGEPSFASAIVLAASNGSKAPFWFRSLVNAPNQVVSIPIVFNDRRMNSIVIVADSSDVVDNAWTGARDAALTGALLAMVAMAATNLLVGRALKPLDAAGAALAGLEAGDYTARAEVGGPPEIVNLNTKINSLAGALSGLERANAELMERAVEAHDQERRVIAHELHDEFGPHLFALRASAAVLAKKLGSSSGGARCGCRYRLPGRGAAEPEPAHPRRLASGGARGTRAGGRARLADRPLAARRACGHRFPRRRSARGLARRTGEPDGVSVRPGGADQRLSPRRRDTHRGDAPV